MNRTFLRWTFYFRRALTMALFLLSACQKEEPPKDDKEVIVPPIEKKSGIYFLGSTFPDGKAWDYRTVRPGDYDPIAQSLRGESLLTPFDRPPLAKTPDEDARGALARGGLFELGPGFIFGLEDDGRRDYAEGGEPIVALLSGPEGSFELTLKSEALPRTATLPPHWDERPKLALSLLSFSQVFPPRFEGSYELTLTRSPREDGGGGESFTLRFLADFLPNEKAKIGVEKKDGLKNFRFGRDASELWIGDIYLKEAGCEGCTLTLENLRPSFTVKHFTELPALPKKGKEKITPPARFTAALVDRRHYAAEIRAYTKSSEEGQRISLFASIPGRLTEIEPWCTKKGGEIRPKTAAELTQGCTKSGDCRTYDHGCQIEAFGRTLTTYYKSLSAIPEDPSRQLLGGSEGVASVSLSVKGEAVLSRGGVVLAREELTIDGGRREIFDEAGLPSWVYEILKNALLSGAPEIAR